MAMLLPNVLTIEFYNGIIGKWSLTFNGYFPLTCYLMETSFNAFANRANPDQAALSDQGLLYLLNMEL